MAKRASGVLSTSTVLPFLCRLCGFSHVVHSSHRHLERAVVPDHHAIHDLSRYQRRLARLNPEGVKVQASFVEGGGHADGLSEVRAGDVVDAVLEGAVRAHIVNHAFRSDDDAVAALLNPLDMLIQAV